MLEGIHTGKGAFLKNFLASRPETTPKVQRHPSILEEPEPTYDLSASMQAMGSVDSYHISGPEFEFEDLH